MNFLKQMWLGTGYPPDRQRPLRWLATLAPLLIYSALVLVFFSRGADWSKYVLGRTNDALLFIWCLHWWPFALTHGLNPFITKYVWFPRGYNLTWSTSVAFPAIVSWPLTALGGPVLSYNVLLLAAPALAGWTAFLLARELTMDWAASLVCGCLFGFSGPELTQLGGELNLGSVYFIPLAVLLCVRRVRGRMRRGPFAAGLSLLLVAQLGTSTEIFTSLCVSGVFAWIFCLILAPAGDRRAIWRLVPDAALCVPLVILLAFPFLYYLAQGASDFPAHIHPAIFQLLDLMRFVFPVTPVRLGWAALASVMRQFAGLRLDVFTFANIPLLLILLLYFCRNLGSAYVRALFATTCMMAALSLGLQLVINGHVIDFPMPWAAMSQIPLVGSILPIRFLTYFTLGAAISTALFLAAAKTTAGRVAGYALAGAALLFLPPAKVEVQPDPWLTQAVFPGGSAFLWTRWPEQPFFTAAHVTRALGKMPNVILFPDPLIGPGMAWQLDAGMSFTQAGGFVGYVSKREQKWDIPYLLLTDPSADFKQNFTGFCAAHRVDYILIGPGTPPLLVSAIEALGWAHHMDEGMEIVKTPANLF